MEAKRLSSSKVTVRKDLFGAQQSSLKEDVVSESSKQSESPLKKIWGESDNYTFTQPTSKSLLLSPALKRSPNKFSTSPSPRKSPGTPKKSPRKLSKYSPFRKKVHNPNPKDTIKRFFPVTEKSSGEDKYTQTQKPSFGIQPLCNPGPSASTSTLNVLNNTKNVPPQEEHCEESMCKELLSGNGLETHLTPNNTPRKSTPTTPKSTPQSASKYLSPNSKITRSKDVYGSFLLRITLDVMSNESDANSVKLFNNEDYENVNTFNTFDSPTQRLYGRLLNRKLDWIRTATMKYGDVNLELMLLEQKGFITLDYTHESLETLLNLLTMPDLKKLCKEYKLPECTVKHDIISKLINRTKKQPSIKRFFTNGTDDSSGESNLRKTIQKLLGDAIKVTSGPWKTFSRCLLYFSYPHYHGLERDRYSDQLSLVSQLRDLSFPSYEIVRTAVFPSREHFLRYEDALHELSDLLEAKEDKNWELAHKKSKELVKKLKYYLANEDNLKEVEMMPDFLRKFTAGGCYVRGASSSVEVFKKENNLDEAESCLELLLSQRLFSRHRRGQWFEQLALLYQHNVKDNVKASSAVLRGLRDEYIDDVSRHTLCARAVMLEGRKKNGLKDYVKDKLAEQRGLIVPLEESPSITITQEIFNSGRPGLKQVYVQDAEDGKMLSSVEEVAREHFRQQGYTHGGHDEGGIIKSLIYACFWNEIYGEAVIDGHGLFHSEYQTAPLDWSSETFYERRREQLKSKLQDLAEGGVDSVVHTFMECYVNNINTESLVNWKYLDNFEITESLIRCIDIDLFLNLSRLLLRHHKIYGAGFPDLTLWNPQEKKCVFVEVKSPNDILSIKQKVWLHSLNKMGANALVCHVQSVGCKSQKRKASD